MGKPSPSLTQNWFSWTNSTSTGHAQLSGEVSTTHSFPTSADWTASWPQVLPLFRPAHVVSCLLTRLEFFWTLRTCLASLEPSASWSLILSPSTQSPELIQALWATLHVSEDLQSRPMPAGSPQEPFTYDPIRETLVSPVSTWALP